MPIQPRRRTFLTVFATLSASLVVADGLLGNEPDAPPPVPAARPNPAFDTWADGFAADWVRTNPQLATSSQYFSGAEQDALDRQLTPLTTTRRRKLATMARAGIDRLDAVLAGPLGDEQRTSAAVMRWSLANRVADEPFEDYQFIFNQFGGIQVGLVNFLTTTHPLRRAGDVANYLARLGQVAARIDEALVRARGATARGLVPPRCIVERAQYQLALFLAPAADQNVLVTSLVQRIAKLPDLDDAARARAATDAARVVETRVRPAYARVQAYLAQLLPLTKEVPGLWRLPNGAAAYQQALRNHTSTNLTAAQIHDLGLREVARLEGEMDMHLRALGYTSGTVEQRMGQLDATFQAQGAGDPRPALLQRYGSIVADAQTRSESLFNLKPRAPIEVRREPALTEASAAAHYTLPAPDGSRPGILWVPMRGPTFDIIKMRTLSYQEAVPGHHFQMAIQQERTDLPKFRAQRIFGGGSAHSEGWGLYAERLALEQNWYDGDVPGLVGALGSELFRARRLVVDTGLHAKGWTRQQAINYGIDAQEVERYIAWPGQACAYMIGMLRILELRERAQKELGARFSLPGFHDAVLRNGSVPLDVLEGVVDGWIAGQSGRRRP